MADKMSPDESTADPTWTIGRLLKWTTDFLSEKGSGSPRLDAEVLLAHARGCPRIELYTAFEEEVSEPVRTAFRELVRRRAEGTPVAYLVGHREFFSLSFRVTPDVLIPRPETELLDVRALDLAKQRPTGKELRIADVGSGSGIIAVCCAKHIQECAALAIDISPAALQVAQSNAASHGVAERITFLESDLFAQHAAAPTFDLILSNPPYVTSGELLELESDVRDHEPSLALDGGEQGTSIIERLIPQAAERLRPGGWLLMEVGPNNAALVEQLVSAASGLTQHATIADLAGHPRVVQAQCKKD
jgi:release factor glutamine methyltransferase